MSSLWLVSKTQEHSLSCLGLVGWTPSGTGRVFLLCVQFLAVKKHSTLHRGMYVLCRVLCPQIDGPCPVSTDRWTIRRRVSLLLSSLSPWYSERLTAPPSTPPPVLLLQFLLPLLLYASQGGRTDWLTCLTTVQTSHSPSACRGAEGRAGSRC